MREITDANEIYVLYLYSNFIITQKSLLVKFYKCIRFINMLLTFNLRGRKLHKQSTQKDSLDFLYIK
jgi:hypothetical protein